MATAVLAAVGAASATPVSQDLGAGYYRVTFTCTAPAGTSTVHLAGTFNAWDPAAKAMDGPDDQGRFTVTIQLEKGRYEYKFVLDGHKWQTDPANPFKAGAQQNAVLFVGIPAEVEGPNVVRPTPEVNMAARAPHPPELSALADMLGATDKPIAEVVDTWLTNHRLPLVEKSSVSFVHWEPEAEAVYVSIKGRGFWTAYDLPRLADGKSVFAVSLKRDQLPDGTVYRYDVEAGGKTRSVLDPHAWSVTSRDGKPVGVLVPPGEGRGRIRLLADVKASSGDLRSRDLYVYTPPGYKADSKQRYPVLYMHDGQNCWDDPTEPFGHGGWQVNLTLDRLIAAGKVEPVIVVGVSNTPDRTTEYGPGKDILAADDHAYLQYLIRNVKPLIDKRFATRSGPGDTGVMGSSMGGIISLQAGLLRPGVFGKIGCLSPALWFEDHQGRGYLDLLAKAGKQPLRIYLDSGTAGPAHDGAPETRRLGQALVDAGWEDGADLMRYEDAGASHNERAWRARLEKPLTFLFGKRQIQAQ